MLIRYWRPLVALVLVGALTLLLGLNRYYAGYTAAEKLWQKRWANATPAAHGIVAKSCGLIGFDDKSINGTAHERIQRSSF